MKNNTKIQSIVVVVAMLFSFQFNGKADPPDNGEIVIIKTDDRMGPHDDRTKAPALVPFTATISADGSFLTTSFQYPMGYVCIEIENDAWSTSLFYYELAEGVVTLPTYLNSGVYTIYFTFDDGGEYYGEFTI